jgi:CheY-like chemotaxis protein
MTEVASHQYRIGLIDDSPEYLDLLFSSLHGKGKHVVKTSKPAECVEWAERNQIDVLVADVRMPEHGLTLAERIQRVSDVEVIMLTGFDPTEEDQQHALSLGVDIYFKNSLDDFLERIDNLGTPPDPGEIRRLRSRVKVLERVHQEWTNDLVAKLREIPDLENAIVSSEEGSFTIAQLIDDIQELRPRGIRYIGVWRRAMGTLLGLRRRQ